MAQKPVLGKGLASLLPGAGTHAAIAQPSVSGSVAAPSTATTVSIPSDLLKAPSPAAQETPNKDRHPGISLANIDEIEANEYQPRRDFDDTALLELSDSITSNGIIQPLVVRKVDTGYQLIAGERRLRAAKLAGLKQVPVVIRRSTDREALELALVENIQRRDLNCIDEALAYFQLIEDFALTQEEVAKRVGKDRASVANHLRLLRLPEGIIEDLRSGLLTLGHGKALLSLDDTELRMRVRGLVIEGHLSVRDTEKLIEQMKAAQLGAGATAERDAAGAPKVGFDIKGRLFQLAQDMTRKLSARVEIKGSEKKGKIVVHYAGKNDLDRLLEAIHGERQLWPEKTP